MSDVYALLVGEAEGLADEVVGPVNSVGRLRLETVDRIDAALAHAGREGFALLILSIAGGTDPADVLHAIRTLASASPRVPTLLVGDDDAEPIARGLIASGAAEFLARSAFASELAPRIEALTRTIRHRMYPDLAEGRPNALSPAGARMLDQIRRVASLDATILLVGEMGSGKTRTAKLIHDASDRRDRPFLTLNCGALSAVATEAELFGSSPGAFAGADRDHAGKIAEAGDGTLLLDDVDALPPALQGKLLRAIESRIFEPVGSTHPVPMRARLIATTGRPLDGEVAAGRFRSDLYYRINVIEIAIPALRDRAEEIPEMAGRFVAEFAERCGREVAGIEPEAMDSLVRHDWPGNVRELRNVLERAVVLGLSASIRAEDLRLKSTSLPRAGADPAAGGHPGAATLADAKRGAEQTRIIEALRKHGNVRLYAARELGISRMTLYKKMYEYGLMERPNRDHAPGQSDDDAA